jgi:fatty acid desaturase
VNTPPTYTFKRPPAALAPRRRRRLLAAAYVGLCALLVASPFLLGGHLPPHEIGSRWFVPAVILFAALMVVLVQLGHATRYIAEDPGSGLDEMMVRLRNRAYRPAYVILTSFTIGAVMELSIHGSDLSDQAKLSILPGDGVVIWQGLHAVGAAAPHD